jgi:hypothetical protein
LLAFRWFFDVVKEGWLILTHRNDLSLSDLALKTTSLSRRAIQAEELDLIGLWLAVFVGNSSRWALLDWLHGEADFLCVLQNLSAFNGLVL